MLRVGGAGRKEWDEYGQDKLYTCMNYSQKGKVISTCSIKNEII